MVPVGFSARWDRASGYPQWDCFVVLLEPKQAADFFSLQNKLTGHTDVVQSLCLNETQCMSASEDGTVRIWGE